MNFFAKSYKANANFEIFLHVSKFGAQLLVETSLNPSIKKKSVLVMSFLIG
jgi:hypothetical protein